MQSLALAVSDIGQGENGGCRYIMNVGGTCGTLRQHGSSYCATHHKRCHIAIGSAAERKEFRDIDFFARKAGGRMMLRGVGGPTEAFLRRLKARVRLAT